MLRLRPAPPNRHVPSCDGPVPAVIPRALLSGVLALVAWGASSCASAPPAAEAPMTPTSVKAPEPLPVDAHLEDVRKNAAEQLGCPLEQVTVSCVRRNLAGSCITVRAVGCDQTFEYQFDDM